MTDRSNSINSSVIVIGEGWGALGAVSLLAASERAVTWVEGTGSRMEPALPGMIACDVLSQSGAETWKELAGVAGLTLNLESGSFLREFRNKAFSSIDPAELEGRFWTPEMNFTPWGGGELQFEQPLAEVESLIRQWALSHRRVNRVAGVPVLAIEKTENGFEVEMGSGEKLTGTHVIYADRLSALRKMKGLPKKSPKSSAMQLMKHHSCVGAVQIQIEHKEAVGVGVRNGFALPMHRESGETFERCAWGYFSENGLKSYWTVLLTPEEVEDNHEITKKIRRLKQTLDRSFTGSEWVPAGYKLFTDLIATENVRLEESLLFSEGARPEGVCGFEEMPGFSILVDGFGPAFAMGLARQVYDRIWEGETTVTVSEARGIGSLPITEENSLVSNT